MVANNKKVIWAGWALSVLSMLPFLPSIFMKFSPNQQVIEGMAHFGFPQELLLTLGILELLSVALYLIPRTAVLGAILIVGYLGGAICTHLRVGENVVMPVVLGVLAWGGLYLRDARLRSLLPLRSKV